MRRNSDLTLRAEKKKQRLSNSLMTNETNAAARRDSVQSRVGKGRVFAFVSDESGDMLVLAAVCLSVLMGALALAVDAGYAHYRECQLQTAADSAAIAAGLEIGKCGNTDCATMNTAAAKALIEDGITTSTITPTSSCTVSSTTGLAMIINVGPCVNGTSDPNNANTHMAEVVLTEPQSTFFGNIFGVRTLNLQARAEAGDSYLNTSNSGGNCIYTKSLEFNSSDGTFTLNNCGLYDNGNLQTNNGDSVKATDLLYYGTWSPNNCNSSCSWTLGDSETQPTHTTTAQADPLASLTEPTQPATSSTNTQTPNNGVTLQPGYYPNGFNLNSNVSVTLASGLYYMGGSINVNSGATLSGTGVELFFENGTLQLNSGSTAQLTAPTTTSSTTGVTAGMLDWQDSTNSSGMDIDSGSSSYFQGVIYLPDAQLTLNSGAGVSINGSATYTAVDVKDLMVNSGETFVINGSGGYLGGGSGKTLGSFALAE